jgi:hypothetical protein
LEQARIKRLDGARERQERLQRAKERIQQEEYKVRDLKNRLDTWVRQYPLCCIRQYRGCVVDTRHSLEECPDGLRDLVIKEVGVL